MAAPIDTEENRIKALLEAWAAAVRRHDIVAILAHHEPDVVMFDVPPPLQCKGIKAYEQTWDLFFRYHRPGAAFDIQELAVTAGQDVAIAVAIMRCGPDSSSNPADGRWRPMWPCTISSIHWHRRFKQVYDELNTLTYSAGEQQRGKGVDGCLPTRI